MSKEIAIKKETYSLERVSEVTQMAKILANHIAKNNLSVNIVGKNYIMTEGWTFAGQLLGLSHRVTKVEKMEGGDWMATAEIIDKKTGSVLSYGYALCSKKESKKSAFDDYAVLSTAQTRAIGKAYRNLIGWVVKLSGYEATPAEEMPRTAQTTTQAPKTQPSAPQRVTQRPTTAPTTYLEKLKARLFKAGATTEEEAVEIFNKKTGMKLKSLKITERHANILLQAWLESK